MTFTDSHKSLTNVKSGKCDTPPAARPPRRVKTRGSPGHPLTKNRRPKQKASPASCASSDDSSNEGGKAVQGGHLRSRRRRAVGKSG